MTAIDPRQIKQDGATDGQGMVWDGAASRWRPTSPPDLSLKADVSALAGYQPLDSDLTAIAGLTTTSYGRGLLTFADVAAFKTSLTLVKGDVGLSLVDNTADTAKPVSTAQQTALNLKADLTALPVKATAADVRAGTDDAKFATAKAIYDGAAPVALTDAATVAVDLAAGINFTLTLGGNRTLGAPSNAKPGSSGVIIVKQDATGSRTLAYNTAWKFFGGAPTLSTAANAVDMISYFVETTGVLRCGIAKASA